jgi:cobalamin biosynthesis protein CobW
MRVVLITGTLGSGKTTFLLHLLAANTERGLKKPLLIINDVGRFNIDAERLAAAGYATKVADMTSGCLDCADREAFERAIKDAASHDEDIFIEPTGAANGDNLQEIFSSCGLKPFTITLLSAAHFERNRAYDPKNMASQVRHANAIGISWFDGQSVDEAPPELIRYVGRLAPQAPLYLVQQELLPPELVSMALNGKAEKQTVHVCSHGCHHHGHDHHDHDHLASFAHSISLSEETRRETIAEICERLASGFGLLRAKGSFGNGQGFDFVHGDLLFSISGNLSRTANFISQRPIPSKALALIDTGEASDDPLVSEAVVAAIEYALTNAWPALMSNGDIREDNAFLYRALGLSFKNAWFVPEPNAAVSEILRKTVVERYVDWYLEVARHLRGKDWQGHAKLAQWHRRVGAHLTLLAINFGDLVGADRIHQIVALKVASMAMGGLLAFRPEHVRFMKLDPVEDPERLIKVAHFAIEQEGADRELAVKAFAHCESLHARVDWQTVWQKTAALL